MGSSCEAGASLASGKLAVPGVEASATSGPEAVWAANEWVNVKSRHASAALLVDLRAFPSLEPHTKLAIPFARPEVNPNTVAALTAVYLASAVYGGVNRSRCNRAKEELAARIARDYEQYKDRVKELEQRVQQTPALNGCSKDLDCKGERLCVATQCVDPPIPPADACPDDKATAPHSAPSEPPAFDPPPPPDSPDPAPSNPQDNSGRFPPLAPGNP